MTPHATERWAFTGVAIFIYFLRVFIAQGWYIVTYALGIYLLNLFLAFLQPKFDPSLEMDMAADAVEEGPTLPMRSDEEFRPFVRRLPEFKFWYVYLLFLYTYRDYYYYFLQEKVVLVTSEIGSKSRKSTRHNNIKQEGLVSMREREWDCVQALKNESHVNN